MDTHKHNFTEALFLMTSALSTLDESGAPFEVKAYLDFAIHRLTDLVGPLQGAIGKPSEKTNAHWIN